MLFFREQQAQGTIGKAGAGCALGTLCALRPRLACSRQALKTSTVFASHLRAGRAASFSALTEMVMQTSVLPHIGQEGLQQ